MDLVGMQQRLQSQAEKESATRVGNHPPYAVGQILKQHDRVRLVKDNADYR